MTENEILMPKGILIGVKGKRIAFMGDLTHKKSPLLLIEAFNEIHRYDPEFTLHLAGNISESRQAVMLDWLIPDLNLQDSIAYHGYINNVLEWFDNMDFVINTSPWEGHCVSVMQGLSRGCVPLLFSSVGIRNLYPDEYIWNSISDLVELIKKHQENPPDKQQYINFVKENYSLEKQLNSISDIVKQTFDAKPKEIKKKESTVSCVIAVKNGEETIGRALISLLNQTKPLDKIVIMDDGSTDNTADVVHDILKDESIEYKYMKSDQSNWVFKTRNNGIMHISSDYFFFLDSDDWVDENYVEEMVKVLDNNKNVSIAYCDMIYFDEKGNEQTFQVPEFDPQILMQRNFIAYSSMQRTKDFQKVGGYSNYLNDSRNHLTEWELWIRYLKNGYGFYHVSKPLFHYFKSGNSTQMSGNYERSRQDMHLQMANELADDSKEIVMSDEKERILLVVQGQDYCDRTKVGFELMTFCKPLEMNGRFEVYTFFYDVEMKYHGPKGMIERFKSFTDVVKPEYIFHMTYKDHIPVEVWKEISEKYCTICFHSDEWRYEEFSKEYEKGFDYKITTYPEVFKKMEESNVSGRILSQWAANPFYFYPRKKDINVSFCGQKHTNREKLLAGLKIEKYGNYWPNGFVDFQKMAEILGRSKISISLSMGVHGRQLKLRPFEITASGALCICEKMPRIEEYFEVEKEIVLFDTKEELKELLDYYLEHEEEAEKIAEAGYQRTDENHLWKHRLEKIFSEIEK